MPKPARQLDQQWQDRYQLAAQYRAEHGHLLIPRSYATRGIALGSWLHRQRTLHRAGALPDARVTALDALGVVWHQEPVDGAAHLALYKQEHGHTDVPSRHITSDGFPLGTWVQSRRREYRADPAATLTRYPTLITLGFTWQLRDRDTAWHEGLQHLRAHSQAFPDAWVAARVVTEDGYPLGVWLMNRRADRWAGRLRAEQIDELDAAGMIWRNRAAPDTTARKALEDARFRAMSRRCAEWAAMHGGLHIPVRYTTDNGVHLGRWLLRQRRLHRVGRLPADRTELLNEIAKDWISTGPDEDR